MVKIRLRRTGAKKKPSYRVVVADSRTPRDGRFIEIVGHYNPRTEPSKVKIHEDRVLYWLSVGAQPTDPVKKLLKNSGTLDRFARLKEGAELEELLAEATAARGTAARGTAAREQDDNGAQAQAQIQAEEVVDEEETKIEALAASEETPVESEETSSEDNDS